MPTNYGVARTNFRKPPPPPKMTHADVAAWKIAVVAAGGVVSAPLEAALSVFVTGLDSAGTWAKINYFFPFWLPSAATIAAAAIDIKVRQVGAFVATPTFNDKAGVAFNGTTQYFDALTPGGGSLNSFALGFDMLNDRAVSDGAECGSSSMGLDYSCNLSVTWSDGNLYAANNDNNTFAGTPKPTNTIGCWTNSRVSSAGFSIYQGVTSLGTTAVTSTVNHDRNFYFAAACPASGVASIFGLDTLGYAMLANGLDATDVTNLVNGWTTYKATI